MFYKNKKKKIEMCPQYMNAPAFKTVQALPN